MKKILGLDIGIASIGWAYVHQATQDNETSSIIGAGVRVVPLGNEAADFTQGKAVTVNAKRRQARSARRNLQRWKLRRKKLTRLLVQNQMLPTTKEKHLQKEAIYQLRAKAAKEQISLTELGRVLLMMNQKRGYQSNRKVVNTDEEQGDYLKNISNNSQTLGDSQQTVGQYLYQQLREKPHARLKGQIFYRSDYYAEFEQIWQTQRQFYPKVLTAELKKEMGDYTLFYQRDLKSQKGRVLRCRFEPKYRVAPKSSPFFQHFRMWQNINNLEVYDDEDNTFQLTADQKEDLFFELDQVTKLSATQTLRKLGYFPTKKYRLNFTEVQGNRTKAAFLKTFAQAGYDTVELLDFDPLEKNPTEQPAYQLWHLLYATTTDQPIIDKLQTDFGFDLAQAKAVCHTKLEKDYGNLSAKAIRKLLPHLQEGHTYDAACELAGYRHSDYLTKDENAQRSLLNEIPVLKRNSLRNPVVEKILNQVINLVNTIIADDKYGRPDEIRVELARE
ncbi:MAG: type II CRISPR RNA-guided endonuclease Cas9, partial [Saprospiraceae bacterium]